MVCEYAVPTVGAVSVVDASVMTGQICSVTACEPWQPLASLARTVMVVAGEAEAVGVPLMTPVLAFNVKPLGSVPLMTVHELYGPTTPLPTSVCE